MNLTVGTHVRHVCRRLKVFCVKMKQHESLVPAPYMVFNNRSLLRAKITCKRPKLIRNQEVETHKNSFFASFLEIENDDENVNGFHQTPTKVSAWKICS